MPLRIHAVVLLLVAVIATGAAGAEFKAEFDVAGLSCGDCAAAATKALRGIDGVRSASVDFDSKKGRVEANRTVSRDEIREALGQFGFEARFPDEKLLPRLSADERAKLDIRMASRGQAIRVRDHLAPGKYTIFDFWAEWCGPCHVLTPKIERLVQSRPDVALRTVDLQSWDSAAGKQATAEFKAPGLPYVRVYGPDGKFIGEVVGNNIEKITQLVQGGRR